MKDLNNYLSQLVSDNISAGYSKQEKMVRDRFAEKGYSFDTDGEWHNFLRKRVTCFVTPDNVNHLVIDADSDTPFEICMFTYLEPVGINYIDENGNYTVKYELEFKIS